MNNILGLLEDFKPLFKSLVANPIHKKSGSSYVPKLSRQERTDFYDDLRGKFIELCYEYDESIGVGFDYYIKSKLSWYAHYKVEKLIEEQKHRVEGENILDELESQNEPVMDEIDPYLLELIDSLSERKREVMDMLYIRGMKLSDVADEMGIAPQAVVAHRKKALEQLRKKIRGF